MQRTVVTLFFMLLGCLSANTKGTDNQLFSEKVSSRVDGRIVNGSIADAAQFPHLVSLRRAWTSSHFCGGSIISEKWILTAAHCMYKNNQLIKSTTFYIVVGGVKLNDTEIAPRQMRKIEELFVHPKFDNSYLVNDAALLLLTEPLSFDTEYVQPFPLAELTPEVGTRCIVAGWGYLGEDIKILSNDLRYVELPLLPQSICKRLLMHLTPMRDGQICAGYTEGQRDACQGDSGGPLMCNGTVTGIVSGGEGCALPNLPGFYSDVAHYRDWINEVQSTTGSCCRCSCDKNFDKNSSKDSSRSSTTVASASLMSTVFIYSLHSLYGVFY